MNSWKPRQAALNSFAFGVKTALLREGKTVTQLARDIQRSRQATTRVIHHPDSLPSVRRRIENHLSRGTR